MIMLMIIIATMVTTRMMSDVSGDGDKMLFNVLLIIALMIMGVQKVLGLN